jgi:hypothetical protein
VNIKNKKVGDSFIDEGKILYIRQVNSAKDKIP